MQFTFFGWVGGLLISVRCSRVNSIEVSTPPNFVRLSIEMVLPAVLDADVMKLSHKEFF